MSKSGLADSPFFAPPPQKVIEPAPITTTDVSNEPNVSPAPMPTTAPGPQIKSKRISDKSRSTTQPKPEKQDTTTPAMQSSNNASMHANMQALTQESIIETIRKAVKDVGKDSATYRFTPEEKKALLELGFSYKMQGYKTSENELTRIAINFLLEDQRLNGRNSVLQRVLDALNK